MSEDKGLLESAVSMHLLVLSAFRLKAAIFKLMGSKSQCTFWCSVLSDSLTGTGARPCWSLNAPFGAQCFPTVWTRFLASPHVGVSMHLLVLSAFRHLTGNHSGACPTSLNAPFGAQCFPTALAGALGPFLKVSMHLLVLSAFRPDKAGAPLALTSGLNAPFGAQCFPTYEFSTSPSGNEVSMHLLVLSAFRQQGKRFVQPHKAPVSMHLLVLSAFRRNHIPAG